MEYQPNPDFFLTCSKCKSPLRMEDYAIDTKTCYNKHVFFLRCPECNGFSATSMQNIPRERWPDFIEENKLKEVVRRYDMAMSKS